MTGWKYWLIMGIVFLIVGGAIVRLKREPLSRLRKTGLSTKSQFAEFLGKNRSTPPLPTPTITPTPTLTPQQIAEIQRKKFEEFNQKYGPCKYVPVLMYHHVMPVDQAKAILATNLNVPPEIFRQQMDYLIGKGYAVIDLDNLVAGLNGNFTFPSKSVVLTFDDGYRDFFDTVYPILIEKNLKATVFVISQFVGGERYMEWWQIREAASSGLVLVGDHTLNHPYLTKLSEEELKNQIVSAKNVIEQNLGTTVKFFAYPYGSANSLAKEILKENNFLGAVVTTNVNPQCKGLPFDLSRIRIGAGSLSRYGF